MENEKDFMSIVNNYVQFDKHKSTYALDANIVAFLIYLLPGIVGSILPFLSSFTTLMILALGIFEKKSGLVKFHCFQYALFGIGCSVLLNVLSLLAVFLPIFAVIIAIISAAVSILLVVIMIWSMISALRWRAWKIPGLGDYIYNKFC